MSEDEMEERLMELLRGSIAEAHDGRRPVRRVPVRRRRLVDERRADVRADDRPGADVLGRASRSTSSTTSSSTRATIAQRFGTDHHEVMIDWNDSQSFLPELIHHQDEPIADWVCVPLYFVSKLARDNGTIVVQVGEGSDELFHGYDALHPPRRGSGGSSGSRFSGCRAAAARRRPRGAAAARGASGAGRHPRRLGR